MRGPVFILLIVLSASCSPAPGADVTAGQIIDNPTFYVGQSLTVSGKVEDIHGPRAFTIDSGMQDGDLLVLGAEPFPQLAETADEKGSLQPGTRVIVTGTVRLFVAQDIEREIGWNLAPELDAEFANRSVIIAQTTRFEGS